MAQLKNQIVPREHGSRVIDPTGMKPTAFLTSSAVSSLLVRTFNGDQGKAAVVTATMLSIIGSNPDYQNCNPMELFANTLRFEVQMGLSYGMGDYAVIPYSGKPQFQLQYQGVCKMAFATGAYMDSDCFEVREGEFKGLDPRTRQPWFEWIVDEDVRQSRPIVGFYAYCKLIDAAPYYGRFKAKYMTHNEIMRHADRYSKAFQRDGGLEAYKKMEQSGNWPRGKTPWFGPVDDTAHQKMCKKTVILQLFKDPILPKSNGFDNRIAAEDAQERTGESITYADRFDDLAREAALAAQREAPAIEAAQAEVSVPAEETPAVEASRAPETAPEPAAAPAKRGRKPKAETAAPAQTTQAPAPAPMPNNGYGDQVPFSMSGGSYDEDDPLKGGW